MRIRGYVNSRFTRDGDQIDRRFVVLDLVGIFSTIIIITVITDYRLRPVEDDLRTRNQSVGVHMSPLFERRVFPTLSLNRISWFISYHARQFQCNLTGVS